MADDPFLNFGEQQESYELLEQYREDLAKDAREMLAQNGEEELVGLIVTKDAKEAEALRVLVKQSTGQDHVGRGFAGIAPREFVLALLRATAPLAVEQLPEGWRDGVRVLPMVVMTKGGVRFGGVGIG